MLEHVPRIYSLFILGKSLNQLQSQLTAARATQDDLVKEHTSQLKALSEAYKSGMATLEADIQRLRAAALKASEANDQAKGELQTAKTEIAALTTQLTSENHTLSCFVDQALKLAALHPRVADAVARQFCHVLGRVNLCLPAIPRIWELPHTITRLQQIHAAVNFRIALHQRNQDISRTTSAKELFSCIFNQRMHAFGNHLERQAVQDSSYFKLLIQGGLAFFLGNCNHPLLAATLLAGKRLLQELQMDALSKDVAATSRILEVKLGDIESTLKRDEYSASSSMLFYLDSQRKNCIPAADVRRMLEHVHTTYSKTANAAKGAVCCHRNETLRNLAQETAINMVGYAAGCIARRRALK